MRLKQHCGFSNLVSLVLFINYALFIYSIIFIYPVYFMLSLFYVEKAKVGKDGLLSCLLYIFGEFRIQSVVVVALIWLTKYHREDHVGGKIGSQVSANQYTSAAPGYCLCHRSISTPSMRCVAEVVSDYQDIPIGTFGSISQSLRPVDIHITFTPHKHMSGEITKG